MGELASKARVVVAPTVKAGRVTRDCLKTPEGRVTRVPNRSISPKKSGTRVTRPSECEGLRQSHSLARWPPLTFAKIWHGKRDQLVGRMWRRSEPFIPARCFRAMAGLFHAPRSPGGRDARKAVAGAGVESPQVRFNCARYNGVDYGWICCCKGKR